MSEAKVRFCQLIMDAIEDERKAQEFYKDLIDVAEKVPLIGENLKNIVIAIRKEELQHARTYELLHETLCREEPLKEHPLREKAYAQ